MSINVFIPSWALGILASSLCAVILAFGFNRVASPPGFESDFASIAWLEVLIFGVAATLGSVAFWVWFVFNAFSTHWR